MKLHKTYYIKDTPNIALFEYAKERWADFYIAVPINMDNADYAFAEDNPDKFEFIPL